MRDTHWLIKKISIALPPNWTLFQAWSYASSMKRLEVWQMIIQSTVIFNSVGPTSSRKGLSSNERSGLNDDYRNQWILSIINNSCNAYNYPRILSLNPISLFLLNLSKVSNNSQSNKYLSRCMGNAKRAAINWW